MAEKKVALCPVCGQKSLVSHCRDNHPTCNWYSCRNRDCDAQIDLTLRIGHCRVLGEPNTRRKLDLGPEAAL